MGDQARENHHYFHGWIKEKRLVLPDVDPIETLSTSVLGPKETQITSMGESASNV
jgi:hypothetical protein